MNYLIPALVLGLCSWTAALADGDIKDHLTVHLHHSYEVDAALVRLDALLFAVAEASTPANIAAATAEVEVARKHVQQRRDITMHVCIDHPSPYCNPAAPDSILTQIDAVDEHLDYVLYLLSLAADRTEVAP